MAKKKNKKEAKEKRTQEEKNLDAGMGTLLSESTFVRMAFLAPILVTIGR